MAMAMAMAMAMSQSYTLVLAVSVNLSICLFFRSSILMFQEPFAAKNANLSSVSFAYSGSLR
jgi:uncharacterized membrane protein